MYTLIKDLANCERPYEKAILYGIESLSDSELLAIILKNGTKEQSSIDLANIIFNSHPIHKGIISLNYLNREKLCDIHGIGDTKATILLAVAEISRRMNIRKAYNNIQFNNPDTIACYYMEKCKYLSTEHTYLMLFSSAQILVKELELSKGTVNQALLSPREVFIEALRYEAVNMILVHNHPSGIPEPSKNDIVATTKLQEACKIMDINLIDHIIIGLDSYVSMFERGII